MKGVRTVSMEKNERNRWSDEGLVIAYLEDKIISNTAKWYEQEIYEQFVWGEELNTQSRKYKQIIHNINKEFNGL